MRINLLLLLFTFVTKVYSYNRCGTTSTYCNDSETCCKISDTDYGCCPYMSGTCCSDYTHCCPNGYNCNLQSSSCEKSSFYSIWLSFLDDNEMKKIK